MKYFLLILNFFMFGFSHAAQQDSKTYTGVILKFRSVASKKEFIKIFKINNLAVYEEFFEEKYLKLTFTELLRYDQIKELINVSSVKPEEITQLIRSNQIRYTY